MVTPPRLTFGDRAVLAAANVWLLIRHPLVAARFLFRGHGAPWFATPRSHGQLVQWRKLVDHNPLFVVLIDKLAVKEWAKARGVDAPAVAWRGKRPEDIPAELLTAEHVIKTNHGTGTNFFPDRESLSREALNARLRTQLARRYGTYGQWAYDQTVPEVFVEKRIAGGPLWEVTVRCCDGHIASWYIARDQKTPREQNGFFDGADNRLPDPIGWPEGENLPRDFVPPDFIAEAKAVASRLGAGLDYARFDLLWDGKRVLFGEATLYPGSGFGAEVAAGIAPLIERAWLETLDRSWFLSTAQPWPRSIYAGAVRRWLAVRRAQF